MSEAGSRDVDAAPPIGRALRRALSRRRALLVVTIVALVAPWAAVRGIPPHYTSRAVVIHRELVDTPTLVGHVDAEETQRQRGVRLRDTLLARSSVASLIRELDVLPEAQKSSMQEAVDEFLHVVDCKVAEDTFTVSATSAEPATAQRMAQRLAERLIDEAAKFRGARAVATRDFIAAESNEALAELGRREGELAKFLANHPEFAEDVSVLTGASAAGVSVRAHQRRAAAADPSIDALEEQRLRIARKLQGAGAPVSPSVAAPMSDEAREALAGARHEAERAAADLSELRTRYTDAHPDVSAALRRNEQAERALADVKRRVAVASAIPVLEPEEEDPRVRTKLSTELRALDETLQRARKRRHSGAGDAEREGVVDLETQWVSLNRAVVEARERQEQLERRHFQAAIVARVESEGARQVMSIVDPAYLPAVPSARAPARVAVAALGAVLLVALVVAVAFGSYDERVVDADEVRELMRQSPVFALKFGHRRAA